MTDDYLLSAEFIENRIEILRSRDLEIPEFHAMQLPLANLLRALLTQRNAADERARALAEAARAEEREACAKVCEVCSDLSHAAIAIRARKGIEDAKD